MIKASSREIVVPSDPEHTPIAGATNGPAANPSGMEPPTIIFRSTDVAPSVPAVPAREIPAAPAAPELVPIPAPPAP